MDSSYSTFLLLVQRLHQGQRDTVECLHAQATAYVWGWQDAGGDPRDTGISTEFGNAYGIIAAQYALGMIGMRPPIQDVWQKWRAARRASVAA